MKYVLEILQSKIESLSICLNDKDWANTGSEYHKDVRKRYKVHINELKNAIKLLNNQDDPDPAKTDQERRP